MPDFFTGAITVKQARKAALEATFAGRTATPPPAAENESTGFDGGARESVPLRPPSHGQWLGDVIRRRLADRGASF